MPTTEALYIVASLVTVFDFLLKHFGPDDAPKVFRAWLSQLVASKNLGDQIDFAVPSAHSQLDHGEINLSAALVAGEGTVRASLTVESDERNEPPISAELQQLAMAMAEFGERYRTSMAPLNEVGKRYRAALEPMRSDLLALSRAIQPPAELVSSLERISMMTAPVRDLLELLSRSTPEGLSGLSGSERTD